LSPCVSASRDDATFATIFKIQAVETLYRRRRATLAPRGTKHHDRTGVFDLVSVRLPPDLDAYPDRISQQATMTIATTAALIDLA